MDTAVGRGLQGSHRDAFGRYHVDASANRLYPVWSTVRDVLAFYSNSEYRSSRLGGTTMDNDGGAKRMHFMDSRQAGWSLAERLQSCANRAAVPVLGLARGGVPVALEIAQALGAPSREEP